MDKYIGTYRVEIERDSFTGDVVKGADTFLRVDSVMAKKGGKVYRFDTNVLVAYIPVLQRARNVYGEMLDRDVQLVDFVDYSDGMDLYFVESDLVRVADLLKVSTLGASTKPDSLKNHPRRKEIQEEARNNRTPEENERLRLMGEKLMESRENKS